MSTDPRVEAVARIAKFCDEWEIMQGHDPDLIYGLNGLDEERGCVLRVSDLRAVLVDPLRDAARDVQDEIEKLRDENERLRAGIGDALHPDKGDIIRCDECGQHWICIMESSRESHWRRVSEKEARKLLSKPGARAFSQQEP